jgi:hypothetical protein
MYLRLDSKGNILLISRGMNIGCVEYTGVIPNDFHTTVGYGKYRFINGEITPVSGWIMPVLQNPFVVKS